MSNIVDFSNSVNSAIQAGSAIEGTAVRVLADNGAEIGQAVAQEVAAGGGAGATVYTLTQAGAGGASIATGVSIFATALPTAFAAIAPCLGVAAGFGLYGLATGDWATIQELLETAGQTIGGKVISYWDGQNQYYTQETIETIKNYLVDIGAFGGESGKELDDQTILNYPDSYETIYNNAEIIVTIDALNTRTYTNTSTRVKMFLVEYNNTYSVVAVGDVWNDGIYVDGVFRQFNQYYTKNNITYYTWFSGYTMAQNVSGSITHVSNILSGSQKMGAWDLGYIWDYGASTGGGDAKLPLQEGAIYPDTRPFYQQYTDWTLHPFPETLPDPSELPKIYPVKYPDTYPLQDPAQNPDPENLPDVYPQIIPDFALPDPISNPEPQPEPEPDPDPQPDPDPITDPDIETPTDPDPSDPNPDPTPSTPIVVPSLPATVSSNKLFTVYNPSAANLDSLGGYLWDGSIIAAIRDIWQEPLDGLISLIQVFVTPTTGGNHNIILGFLDSGVSAPVVSSQFVTVDCGSVTINEDKQNATDYAPYTSIHLYLPFIGFVELDTNEVMNSTISVRYKVDVYTGTCLAQVSVSRTTDMPDDPILYTYSGNCSQQIPLTSGNATGMLSALIGGITAGLSVASGGGLGIMAGAQILGNSLTHDMFHVNHSGNLSANAGIMGQKKPYIIIGRRHGYDANNYSHYYGYPVNKTVVLGNHTGFAQVKKCLLQTTATKPEYDEILSLLENGVIL